jgi:transcriptional regulator with XRE-family HTH domain
MALSTEELGRRLARARNAAGFTQAQVGEYLKVPREWISYVENGRRQIDISALQRLSDLYGINVSQFFEDPTNPNFDPSISAVAAFRATDISERDLATVSWVKRFAMNLNDLNRLLEGDGP